MHDEDDVEMQAFRRSDEERRFAFAMRIPEVISIVKSC